MDIGTLRKRLKMVDIYKVCNEVEIILMEHNDFDICFHTCILGGRRTKAEDYDVVYINLLMFENLMKYSHK